MITNAAKSKTATVFFMQGPSRTQTNRLAQLYSSQANHVKCAIPSLFAV
jgi:hypothetical protein